jgi:hypothetical protein
VFLHVPSGPWLEAPFSQTRDESCSDVPSAVPQVNPGSIAQEHERVADLRHDRRMATSAYRQFAERDATSVDACRAS